MRPKCLLPLLFATLTVMPIMMTAAAQPMPPIAEERPVKLKKHGNVRVDPYFWLRERENPEVTRYLELENAYFEQQMAPLRSLQTELFREIKGRIKQDDASVPYRLGQYFYYWRFEDGSQYAIHARKANSLDAKEEILLNVNELAKGHDFYSASISSSSISPSGRYIAWVADTVGRRFYTIYVLDTHTGQMLPDVIPNTTGNLVWANDDRTFFYTKQNSETLRAEKIYRHRLGMNPAEDPLIYEEKDETFSTYVTKTKDNAYILIGSHQTLSTEFRLLDANTPQGQFDLFLKRDRGHEYYVEHAGGAFYILSNREAENFRLMRWRVADQKLSPDRSSQDSTQNGTQNITDETHWEAVLPHRDDVFLASFATFQDFLVVEERKDGLSRLWIRPWDNPDAAHYIAFDDPAYDIYFGQNPNFDTPTLRYGYESPTIPPTTYDYDVNTRERTQLKRNVVLGDFKPENYQTERLMVPARDGAQIPVTLVYRKDRYRKKGSNPLLLYGYGSYGASIHPFFSTPRLSLLDRGFAYAIAHVRGSQTLGRRWYEDGKLLKKKNTFTDFIDVGKYFVEHQYVDRDRLYGMGGSAGGLLMGAVVNLQPDLFDGIIANVPFVDVVTTMLDDSIPLTTGEYDEWGDPNDPEYYDYMLSYSPYDNVKRQNYPHMLVTTGLNDSQVQYWEPAKWVAKLRSMKTDNNQLLLFTDMDAGHGGASGRFDQYQEIARDYAFLLDIAGLNAGSK